MKQYVEEQSIKYASFMALHLSFIVVAVDLKALNTLIINTCRQYLLIV